VRKREYGRWDGGPASTVRELLVRRRTTAAPSDRPLRPACRPACAAGRCWKERAREEEYRTGNRAAPEARTGFQGAHARAPAHAPVAQVAVLDVCVAHADAQAAAGHLADDWEPGLLLRRGPHAVASSTCSCSSCSSLPGGVSWLSSGSSPARWWWAASCEVLRQSHRQLKELRSLP